MVNTKKKIHSSRMGSNRSKMSNSKADRDMSTTIGFEFQTDEMSFFITLSFYTQSTIGVELKYVVWALSVLADVYLSTKFKDPEEEKQMRLWNNVIEYCSLTKDPLLNVILVLLAYSYLIKKDVEGSSVVHTYNFIANTADRLNSKVLVEIRYFNRI
jgi:hypothetical protein